MKYCCPNYAVYLKQISKITSLLSQIKQKLEVCVITEQYSHGIDALEKIVHCLSLIRIGFRSKTPQRSNPQPWIKYYKCINITVFYISHCIPVTVTKNPHIANL